MGKRRLRIHVPVWLMFLATWAMQVLPRPPITLDQLRLLLPEQGLLAVMNCLNSNLPSLIFWGPPGSGKTTLAHLLAKSLEITLFEISAVSANTEEIRKHIGADTLGYLSLEGMLDCVSKEPDNYCTACWTGNYSVQPVDIMRKDIHE